MRLTVEAPFDLGLTFGLGGEVFEDRALLQTLREKSMDVFQSDVLLSDGSGQPATLIDDHSGAPFGVRKPYGAGVSLKIMPGPFVELWRENARAFWSVHKDALTNEFSEPTYTEVLHLLTAVSLPYATLFAFELGVAYVRLHADLPPVQSGETARSVFKAFENAGYGDGSGSSANAMVARWRLVVRDLFSRKSDIATLTERAIAEDFVDFAGFQGIVISEHADRDLPYRDRFFRPGDERLAMRYGDLNVTVTWLLMLVEGRAGFEYDYNRLLYVGMCHRLAWEVSRIFEDVFAAKMRLSIHASIENNKIALSRKQLNRIRQFAALILTMSAVENVSDYPADLEFSRFFDKFSNISKRQQRISLAAAALAEVEADIVVTDERKLSKSVNVTLLILTIVSLVGVSAGVIQSWESGLQLFQNAPLLIFTLAAPSLLTLIAILAGRGFRR